MGLVAQLAVAPDGGLYLYGVTVTTALGRSTMALPDPNDAMSFTTITDTTTVSGKIFLEVFAKTRR